ncbi:MAG: hypothetical protein GXP56_09075 [Deltaproteobacteria bacterium]|nr:hypothetical protein [Deltaproteobacteria bacterium]
MSEINPEIPGAKKISLVDPGMKQGRTSQKGDGSFDKILTNHIKKGDNDTPLKNTSALPEIEGSFNAQRLKFKPDRTQFTLKFASSLDMLEKYASLIGDPGKTLKQAYDILEQASGQAETLAREFKEDKALDTDFKKLLTRLMTTIEVEKFKFNRGDYSDL